MDKKTLCCNLGIQSKKIGTLEEYKNRYKNSKKSEQHFRKIMDLVQENCESIIFLGGQTVRPNTMGWRQIRRPSEDLDMYLRDLYSLGEIKSLIDSNGGEIYYALGYDMILGDLHGTPISIHLGDIYGVKSCNIYSHVYRNLRMLKPECLSTLKLKRKGIKGNPRAKDIQDVGSLILSATHEKIDLNLEENETQARNIGSQSISENFHRIVDQGVFKREEIERIRDFFI